MGTHTTNDDYDYDNNYKHYESEQYDEEYRPSSSIIYTLDRSDSHDSYTHQTTWSAVHNRISHNCAIKPCYYFAIIYNV